MSNESELGYIPALALFDKPSINTGVISHKWIQYSPISTVSNTGVMEFYIPGTSDRYINLKCSNIQIKGKIVKDDGSKITDDDFVGLINAPLHTIWSQIDLQLQHKVVNTEVGTNYAYKAYLDLLLNKSPNQRNYQLSSQLYIPDRAGGMDDIDETPGGVFLRIQETKNSREIQIEGPLCLDLCDQDRYIINGVPLKLRFWPNKPEFYLLSKEEGKRYRFHITDAYLNLCTVEVSPAILVGHAAGLEHSPVMYPFYQSSLKTFEISEGAYSHTVNDIFQGDVPSDVIVGLVPAANYSGQYKRNPFNFHHFNLSSCGFFINGVPIPKETIEPIYELDEESKDGKTEPPEKEKEKESVAYTEAYLSLFGENYDKSENIPITLENYPNGYCLYKFQISQAVGDSDFVSLARRGTTKLIIKFRKPLKEGVTLIMYARFPRIMQIDKSRNVVM